MLSMNKSKRKHNSLPLCTKLNAIKQLENETSSVYQIADELNVHHTTVRSWQKNKDKLCEWSNQFTSEVPKKKKRLSKGANDNVDKAMWIWFREKHASGTPLSGPIIQAQAMRFNAQFDGEKTFVASNGWLRNWKDRYGIRVVSNCGEKSSGNTEAVEPFKKKFVERIKAENLTMDQVFYCNESGLNYKMLPKTALCTKSKASPSDLKGYKDRITVISCSNASGTFKLPLTVIGKWAKSRALKNRSSLPISYKNQKSAWITGELFTSWFENEFVPAVKVFLQIAGLPSKALLVMNNCSSHNTAITKDGISVMYFPANTTSLIQPMDQGCRQNLKLLYKQQLMNFVFDSIAQGLTLNDAVKKITIREGINWIAAAWDRLTIKKSWNRVWPWEDRSEVCEAYLAQKEQIDALFRQFCAFLQSLPAYKNIDAIQLEQWLHPPHLMTADECLTDSEIIQVVREENHEEGTERQNENRTERQNEEGNENQNVKEKENNNNEAENNRLEENIKVVTPSVTQKVTEKEAQLCLKYLLRYCKDNCYPQESITALYKIQGQMEKNSDIDSYSNLPDTDHDN